MSWFGANEYLVMEVVARDRVDDMTSAYDVSLMSAQADRSEEGRDIGRDCWATTYRKRYARLRGESARQAARAAAQ